MQFDPFLAVIALPLAAGLACLVFPDRFRAMPKAIAMLTALGAFAGSVSIFVKRPPAWEAAGWAMLSADNLSAFIGLSIALLALAVIVYSCGFVDKRCGAYFGYALMTLGASFGVAYADNLVLMATFWGFLAATFYMLANIAGTERAALAARKAIIIIGGTDALMIFGIGIIWTMSGTFTMDAIRLPLSGALPHIAYLCIAAAAFAKAGAVPLHSWLPDIAEDAPTPVSAYLPASLDKLLGIYLLARASLGLFAMSKAANTFLLVIGSVTIIVAVMMALAQHNFKRLLGYHAVSQVGYMVLGIGLANPIGIAGALFHMLNHALYKSCLFMTSGAVEKRTGTLELNSLGGLARYMPLTFLACLIASLSISGIPPFNGFFSKWMIYQGIISSATPKDPLWVVWLLAAMFGSALTVASFMKLIHAVFLGRSSKDYSLARDPGVMMTLSMVSVAFVCVIFGVFAFIVPIPLLIAPVMGKALVFTGSWRPIAATAVLVAGIAAGALAYLVFRPGKFRISETFVGGEDPASLERVSGTEFYDTIGDLRPVRRLYDTEAAGAFDAYAISGKLVELCVKPMQALHNGVLPTYLVWALLGMVSIFTVLFFVIR